MVFELGRLSLDGVRGGQSNSGNGKQATAGLDEAPSSFSGSGTLYMYVSGYSCGSLHIAFQVGNINHNPL
jgi:hypothetical protein